MTESENILGVVKSQNLVSRVDIDLSKPVAPEEDEMGMNGTECPTCKGSHFVRALVNYGGKKGCVWESVPCITCDGLGHVSLDFAEKLAAGEKLYQARVAAGISVRDAATARGMTIREYVDLEHGR